MPDLPTSIPCNGLVLTRVRSEDNLVEYSAPGLCVWHFTDGRPESWWGFKGGSMPLPDAAGDTWQDVVRQLEGRSLVGEWVLRAWRRVNEVTNV